MGEEGSLIERRLEPVDLAEVRETGGAGLHPSRHWERQVLHQFTSPYQDTPTAITHAHVCSSTGWKLEKTHPGSGRRHELPTADRGVVDVFPLLTCSVGAHLRWNSAKSCDSPDEYSSVRRHRCSTARCTTDWNG